uniref:Pleckstrin homology domain containing A5 n=1 Tax=Oncorhynchus tshawytscha TaxID=74940 RepID=A0A8C8FQ80_ONCTS
MAADLNPDWLSCLPSSWSYGVARDGRIFFINEEAKSTTWLHPVTGEAVITGHRTTPDLPTGWEEGYTFEGARCFINHNERKVTCKHPVSGLPSQDNCIFVVNEHDRVKKERPMSTMSQASNYTGGSDYSTYPGSSPATRPSRSYKKVHNFGKRSNSIKRNPNAPAVKSNWLYKQDSTGMKLWKKRWFVLSDMCLFYYRDEKEEGILGSILLPSFHISMLSVDDHVSRKYAFKATHSNMRTYYFCTDTAKDMESWMKVMTDAALVHTEPIRRWKYKTLREGSKCGTLRDGEKHGTLDKYGTLREVDKYGTLREGNKYGFQRDGSAERPLTKINSIKLQPAQAAAIAAAVTASRQVQVSQHMAPHQVNGSGERAGDQSPGEVIGTLARGARKAHDPPQNQTQNQQAQEPEKSLTRTNSMRQLENWVRTQRTQEDDDTRSITSYQTLPRNMPSHRAQIVPRYPEGYRTLPRNMLSRPESICSVAGSVYDRALAPTSNADKRRSMRDDTMWQLYEWQQRQAFSRQGPPPPGNYGTLPSPKTMGNISEHQGVAPSIPTSPSHGSLALYHTFSPPGQHRRDNPPGSTRSEVSSPIFRGDQTMTIDCRHRTHLTKYNYPPDRRSMPAGIPVQTITPQSLQGKTVSHVSLSDLLHLFSAFLCCADLCRCRLLPLPISLQNTLETALLSASQEIEQSSDNPAAVQSLIQQRDVLQNGLLSTCRELARVKTELERSWREYDKMESGVSLAKTNLLEQLEALGSPQTEPPSQQHVHIQKELWRIQDVMEALAKNKPQRTTDTGFLGSKPISNLQKNEGDRQPLRPPLPQSYGSTERPPAVPPLPSPSGARPPPHTSKHGQRNGTHSSQGPDYRLYKSEPELTTVAEEVDDNNGEDNDKDRLQAGLTTDKEPAATKGVPVYPVGIVPPRTKSPMSPPESCTIASYVTLRKGKKPDPRTERPHSAVEQTCGPGERESGRARMSVEEQLERIRRHQQASLREKKRSSSSISPSRSPSFSKENPFVTQVTSPRTAVSPEEALDIDTAALVELEMEITVVEEISYRAEEVDVIPVLRLSEEEPQPQTESSNMDTEVGECPYSHRPPESRICMADNII